MLNTIFNTIFNTPATYPQEMEAFSFGSKKIAFDAQEAHLSNIPILTQECVPGAAMSSHEPRVERSVFMADVARSLSRMVRYSKEPWSNRGKAECLNLDEAVLELDALADQLDRLAKDETSPLKGVVGEMANVIRRAGKDAWRLLLDARGY